MKAKLRLDITFDNLKFKYEKPNEEMLIAAIKDKVGASDVTLVESHYLTENDSESAAISELWCME
jgi:hypothetical protein